MQHYASSTATGDLTTTSDYLLDDTAYSSVLSPQPVLSLIPFSESRFVMKHQDLVNQHALCLTRLREAAKEVECLRQENVTLRSVNSELNNQLSFLIKASAQSLSCDYNAMPLDIVNRFHNSCNIGSGGGAEESYEDESPTSVMEVSSVDTERNWLPKSISVRSNSYLKVSQPAIASKSLGVPPRSLQTSSSLNAAQKVYVRGQKKEEDPLELEVYNQGMSKTELCNKWQETGACPYGENCQFAHGIEELRPVIRHPRYKTEVCRMILAGDLCPYGHRCHFRHALTEQEKLMGKLRPSALKLDR